MSDTTTLEVENAEDLVLTTIDNPYNPKEDYDNWRRWDIENGYHTEEYLARMMDVPLDVDMDDEVTLSLIADRAMQEIIEHDMAQIYKLV